MTFAHVCVAQSLIGRRFLSDVFLSLPESFESVVHRAQPFARLPRFRQTSVPVTLVYVCALAAGLAAALAHAVPSGL